MEEASIVAGSLDSGAGAITAAGTPQVAVAEETTAAAAPAGETGAPAATAGAARQATPVAPEPMDGAHTNATPATLPTTPARTSDAAHDLPPVFVVGIYRDYKFVAPMQVGGTGEFVVTLQRFTGEYDNLRKDAGFTKSSGRLRNDCKKPGEWQDVTPMQVQGTQYIVTEPKCYRKDFDHHIFASFAGPEYEQFIFEVQLIHTGNCNTMLWMERACCGVLWC